MEKSPGNKADIDETGSRFRQEFFIRHEVRGNL